MTVSTLPLSAKEPIVRDIFSLAERKGITLVEMADRSGLDKKTISFIRHPRQCRDMLDRGNQPRLYQVQALAGILGLELKLVPKGTK